MSFLDLHEGILAEFAERQGAAGLLEALSGVDSGAFDLRVIQSEAPATVAARAARWRAANPARKVAA